MMARRPLIRKTVKRKEVDNNNHIAFYRKVHSLA